MEKVSVHCHIQYEVNAVFQVINIGQKKKKLGIIYTMISLHFQISPSPLHLVNFTAQWKLTHWRIPDSFYILFHGVSGLTSVFVHDVLQNVSLEETLTTAS